MKRIAIFVLGIMASAAPADQPPDSTKLETKARAFVTAFTKEDFNAATAEYDEAMQKALPAEKLGDLGKTLVKQVGPFQKQGEAATEKVGKYDVVWITCEYEKATLYARLVFTAEGKITGLSFRPTGPAKPYNAPAYVKRDAFTERDVKVGEGEWSLPGTLTIPVGDGPFPAVVLLHGSGPQDRDETLGSSRPLRDLAWGLASRGIAVLRFEKRTKQYGAKMVKTEVTTKEEVLDDAHLAIALLRTTKGIDAKKVYVLGHSLGAIAAPKIAEKDSELAGIILLAGSTRPLEDLIIEQMDYILSLEKKPSDEMRTETEKIKKAALRLKDPKLPADTPDSELPFGQPLTYWRSVTDLKPGETAAKLRMPILVLQGERDYQVTKEDFDLWRQILKNHSTATFKLYPKLNHFFAEGEGKARPEEYLKESHVSAEVIDDIAKWIVGK
jgi:dienelactone hydrolase